MVIKTKFDIGSEVFFIFNNRVYKQKISKIRFTKELITYTRDGSNLETSIEYSFDGNSVGNLVKKEEEVFATKEELLNSL